jgi:hypothetical protein
MEIPYFLAFGRLPVLPADLEFNPEANHSTHVSDFLRKIHDATLRARFNTLMAQESRRASHNATRVPHTLTIGSYAVLSYPPTGEIGVPKKFNALYRGIFRVTRCISDLNCRSTKTSS